MKLNPTLAYLRGRYYWQGADGRLVPRIRGADGDDNGRSLEDLHADRGAALTRAEGILATARQAQGLNDNQEPVLDEAQRSEFRAALEEVDRLDREIAQAAERSDSHALVERFGRAQTWTPPVFHATRRDSVRSGADWSLEELLWATQETVRAGTWDPSGVFRPHPAGIEHYVEPVSMRSDLVGHQDRSGHGADMVDAPRMSDFAPEHRRHIRAFQNAVTDMVVFGFMADRSVRRSSEAFQAARSNRRMRARWDQIMRALDVDTSGEGLEFIPTGLGASLHERIRASGKLAPLFARINLPTNPWKWPLEGADATAYRVAEPTSDTESKMAASTPGTGQATFDAEIMGGRVLFSRSIEQDSIIAILPYVRSKLVQAFLDAEEKAILDGDADGTHQDSDVQAIGATDVRTAWDGLRKRGLANASASGGGDALTVDDLTSIRALMAKYGLNPAEVVAIVGVSGYYDLVNDTNVATWDKIGPNATLLNGQLAAVQGVPIIVSEHVREDLNASGVHDGVTTNLSYALLVNRNEWVMGQRMGLDIEVDDSIYRETFQRVVVGFLREDFQNINATGASEDDTAVIYNVLP